MRDALSGFEWDAGERQRDHDLATDLIKINTGLIDEEIKLHDSLIKSMLQDSNDLEKCDGKNY
jgi:hypothetical protein